MAGGIALPVVATVIVLIVYLTSRSSQRVPAGLKRVPGPRGWPIVGNLPQLGRYPHQQLLRWARQYGPIFQIRVGWETQIYVNEAMAVKDIFDRQSAVTSGRQPFPVASDIMSGGKRVLFMTHNKEWRTVRGIVHKLLTPKASADFMPSQEFEAKQMLYDILQDQESGNDHSAYQHVRRYTTSVIMTSTYGERVADWDNETVRQVYGVMNDFNENMRPGVFLADQLPPLARLPKALQWWRARAEAAYDRQAAVWLRLWGRLNKQIDSGVAPDCFVKQLVETQAKKKELDDVQCAFVAGTMIEAGSETTSAALNSAIPLLATHPEVQRQARAELDRVVGQDRMPTFADEPDLPYIRAIVKEVLRMRPTTTIGAPHYTTHDLEYDGYYIPANVVITINQYALQYDERRHKDPEKFMPERYLNNLDKAGVSAAQPDPYKRDHFSFGGGRRICPGLHLAENSLFILLSMVLWAFEIRAPLGADKVEVPVDTSDDAYEEGVNTIPKPYRMRFIPVTAAKGEKVKQEWLTASKEGYTLGHYKVDQNGVVV